ncbi:MAG TPA: hypothetical protein VM095_02870 [Pyrinomonadaceae bacterium]|nr:hypothetical protein [Pyrinomonadaceae bacterium]
MFWRRLLSSAALTVLLLAPLSAQTPEDQSALGERERQQKALEQKKELERKTYALLEEIIGAATLLKLPENRALVQSSAADLLWTRDEKRARALFRDALENLRQAAPKISGQLSNEQRAAYQLFIQQRKETLQIVARRDPDLALELLRATRPPSPSPPPPPLQGIGQSDEETRMEQTLAVQVAANDPKRALAMAEESLSKGLSFELLGLLGQLNDKNKDMAKQLATDIISKLSSENLLTNHEAAWLAVVFLRMSARPQEPGSFMIGVSGVAKHPYVLDERQLRDLLEMITTAALVDSPNDILLTFLPQLMPEIEKRMPERVAALRRRIMSSGRKLEPQERVRIEYQELMEHGTIDALLEAAGKAPDLAREALYEQAAWKALYKENDAERARRIINEHIRDASRREQMLQDIERSSLWEAIRKERIDEVRSRLSLIKTKEERAGVLVQLAYSAAARKDKKLALQLLEEARPLVSFKPKNDQQLYTVLQMTRVYALTEPARAYELIESLVDQANELLSAASVLSGFFLPSGVFRKGEMVLPPGYSNVSMRFRQFGKELGALALLNFERTKAAADKFQRNETRIMARLFIAQAVLSERLGSGVAIYDGGVAVGY